MSAYKGSGAQGAYMPAVMGSGRADMRWWLGKDDCEVAEGMTNLASSWRIRQSGRIDTYLHWCSLYYGYSITGLGPNAYFDEPDVIDSEPIADNVSRQIVKAAIPRVAKSKPRPMFLTIRGKWSERMRARDAEQIVAGHIHRLGMYRKGRILVRNAAVFGTSAWRFFLRDGLPAVDVVHPWQLICDPRDSYYGEPRALYYWQYIDRQVLSEMYPEHEKEIADMRVERDPSDDQLAYDDCDQLLVWHAWHLPSGDGAGDGRYCVAVGDCLLHDDEWTRQDFPFAFYRWDEPIVGFFGEGLVREVSGHQYELNAVTRTIRLALRASIPRYFLPMGCKVVPSDLDDRVGTMIQFAGATPPFLSSPTPINQQFVDWRNQVREDAFHETGISQLSANSQKPAGLNAAVALQRYDDIEDTRFMSPADAWEQLFVQSARQIVALLNDGGAKSGGAYDATRKRWREVKWQKLDLDAESYHLQVYPVSQLPSDPTGKSDLVESWYQSGVVDQNERRQLLDFPDTDAYSDLYNAPYDVICMQCESILFDGEPKQPDPTLGPDGFILGAKLGRLYYCAAVRDGAPEDVLALMRDYLDLCATQMQANAPAPAPAPQMPAGAGDPLTPGQLPPPVAPPTLA